MATDNPTIADLEDVEVDDDLDSLSSDLDYRDDEVDHAEHAYWDDFLASERAQAEDWDA